jgi:hypothetical protein
MMQLLFIVVSLLVVVNAYSQEFNSTSTTTCICTTVPCPVSGYNYLTTGGGAVGKYYYSTHNGYAVVTSASITITSSNLDTGTDTTSCTQDYSRMLDDDGVQDCDAGHILANRLGGPGNQPINIFPQDSSINRGTWAQFEDNIYDCIKGGASSASLSWQFTYESTSHTKPYKATYSVTYSGGSCSAVSASFSN